MATTADRRRAEIRGRRAEVIAAWLLRVKFYRILAWRYKTPAGEIDLVARRGRTIAFVEVKRRARHDAAIEAVTPAGRRRIARAATLWRSAHPEAMTFDQRFDVIVVAAGRLPRHLTSVFDDLGGPW